MDLTTIPKFQDFNIEGVKHISPTDAYFAIDLGEALLLDVREPDEIKLESIRMPDVLYHPMSVIMDRLEVLPTGKLLITACPGGVRSVKVANLLISQGFSNVANLDGGLMMWKAKGLPYESSVSFGCGCNSQPAAPEKKPSFQELLGGGLRLDVQKPIPTPLNRNL